MSCSDAECLFCDSSKAILRNDHAFARFDDFPVNPGHCLIIPHRHFASFFEATVEERAAILALVDQARARVDTEFQPGGYNIGVNVGPIAGQSVMHLHVHLIPRYAGDVENPKGGVRGVIPSRQKYDITQPTRSEG
ncbi:MAG: HIT family protein [Gammaproteobacteria bacterium]|nr:HIT family protein [Gammaproteobacteria bacterium]